MADEEQFFAKYPNIFHYTNIDGLRGIIKNQVIWATCYQFLNDITELEYAYDIIKNWREKDNKFTHNLPQEDLKKLIELVSKTEKELARTNIFISSFSAHEENSFEFENGMLSQWRGYGKEQGFALVFDTKIFWERFNSYEFSNNAYNLSGIFEVVYPDLDNDKDYDGETLKRLRTLNDNLNCLNKCLHKNVIPSLLFRDVLKSFNDIKYACKHPGFQEEKEVRIVAAPILGEAYKKIKQDPNVPHQQEKKIKFRGDKNDIPYLELESGNSLKVVKIIIGPGVENTDKIKKYLELWLNQFDDERRQTQIAVSKTPYVNYYSG